MYKRIISCIAVAAWMTLIFSFSAQPAKDSAKLSHSVQDKIIAFVEKVCPPLAAVLPEKGEEDNIMTTIIRKSAHFSLYAILGVLSFWMVSCFYKGKYTWLFAALISAAYAVSDEFHQRFVTGRSCELRDMLIDTLGAMLGAGIVFLFYRKRKKGR